MRKVGMAFAVLAAAAAAPALCVAQQPQDRGWYVGASAGISDFKRTCDSLLVGCDSNDFAWKLFGGYQLNRNVSFEGGYADLGEARGDGTIGGLPASFDRSVTAWDLAGVLWAPLGERFSLFGKLGVMRSRTKLRGTLAGGPADASENNTTAYTFGAGVQYKVGAQAALRAEWQKYPNTGGPSIEPFLPSSSKDDIDLFTLGLTWKF